ncbi:oxidized low density lipoprotein (lectin-like) receptor 1 [Cricetulus griseus]
MNLEMTFDDKMKPVNEQPDQKLCHKKAKVLQVSDLLKQYQANLTRQEHTIEGQILAQQQTANASQQKLKETIDTLTWELKEKTKEQEGLLQQNLNLQKALQRAANFSVLQVSDLLRKYQANLTHQERILERQILAQQQAANASQQKLKETIDTLTWELKEKTKDQEELLQQNLNLQKALQKVANFSGTEEGQ